MGFVWLNLQFSVSWQVDFQWGSCGSIFSFLCHVRQTFSGVRVSQSLVFCVMVGRLLMGFVWLNLQFSVSWQVDFQWALCGSIFRFLCHGRYTFSGVRVAQSFVFCVMVGRLLVGFVWLNLQLSVSWQVDFQWGSCGLIFSFLWHGWQTFSGVRVSQSLVFCIMVGGFQWGSCGSIFSFLCYGRQTFSGVRVAQSLDFCVMLGRLLVGFVCLNLQFSVSWLVDFQWGSCGSIFSFLCHGRQTLVGFVWLNLQFSVSWLVDFQWGSCGSIFSFLCHGRQTFSGVRVGQSLVFCVMVGRLLVGFVSLNLQSSVSWQVDFQWGSCGSIFNFLSWLVDFQWCSCGSNFSFLCHGRQTFSGVRVAQSLVFCVMVDRLLVGFVWLNLLFSVSRLATFSGVRVAQSLVFCLMVGRLLVGFVWLNLQFSASWFAYFQWGSCVSIFNFLCYGRQTFSGVRVVQSLVFCHGRQTFSGVRVALSLVFCVMVGRLLGGFVWLNLQISVSCQVDFQWGSCVSIFSFLCHGWQTFSGVRVAQSLVFCIMVGRLQWGSCGSIFSFRCHGWQIFSGVRVAQSLVFCVMVGRLLVGFVCANLQFSVSWLVDFQWDSCRSIFSLLCHGRQTFSGVRVAQSLVFCHGWQTFSGVRVVQTLVFCVMVGRHLVGFVWLNLLFSVSRLATFSGVRVAQSLVFCLMVGRLLVGFVCLNLQFSVSWLVDFQWGSCGSIFRFLCHVRQTFSGVRVSIFSVLCHGWQTFSGVRVAQSLVFCGMVGRLLVGFVWLNLQSSMSWQVDFQWGSCGSIFSFLCHGWQIFSGVRVAQSLVFCGMVGRLLVGFVWLNLQSSMSWQVDFQWGSCGSIFSFLCHGWQIFSGVRVAQSLIFCVMVDRLLVGFVWFNLQFSVMVGRLLVGFVWLNLQFSVSWQVDFQWGSCGSIFSFLCHVRQTFSGVRVSQSLVFCVMVGRLLMGFVWLNLQFSVSWLVDFQWGSCGSIFSFLCHVRQTFSGVRVSQSLVFCVMVGRLLMGFVWLNLQFSVSWQVDFQWALCGSIFRFLCHGRYTFSGVRVAQSFVFCVMVGRLLVGFVWLNLQLSVSWQVDFQWGSCGLIFSFLWHGWQTFSGVRVSQSLVFCIMVGGFQWGSCGSIFSFLCYGRQTFSGVRVAQSLDFCVMLGRLLVGFVCLNLQFSVSWLVDFQWGSCGSIFSFLCHGRQTLVGFVWLNLQFSVSWLVDFQWGSCGSIFSFLCHGRQTFSGVRVGQSLVFCVMVGRLLVGFVSLNLQSSVSWQVDFQWGSCGSIFNFLSWLVDFQWCSCGSNFSFLCHGRQTFSGVRVAQSLVFCVMVDRLLVGFVWLNLLFSVSRLATFSGVRVAQSLVFCLMVGRLLVGFVWLNLQFSASWFAYFQWGSCVSIFNFLCYGRQTFSGVRVVQSLVFCHGRQTFSGVRVALSLVFCVMVGRLLGGFVWLNLQISVSCQVDFQWGSCVSIFSFLCHGWQTFSGVRVAQSLVFCVMVGRLQWGSCGSIFSFRCHGWQIFSGVRVAQSLVFCVMVGRLLVGFVWANLQFSVSWLVDFQWDSCRSIFSLLCHGRQTFSGVRVAQSLIFCHGWYFQWCSCGSNFSFLCHGRQTFSGVRVAQSLVFCVMVDRLLVGFVWLNLLFSVSRLATFSGVRVAQSLVFCLMVGRLLVGFVWLNLQFSASWFAYFQWGSCVSIFNFLCYGRQTFSGVRVVQSLVFCHGRQTFSGVRVAQSLVFCVMVGRLLVGFVWANLQFSVSWLVDFQWCSCGSIFSFLCHGRQTFSGVRVAQYLVFCVMVDRLLVGFVKLNLQFSVSSLATFSGVRVAQSLVFCLMVGRLLVGFVRLNLQFSASWFAYFQWGSCVSIFSFLCYGRQTFSGVRVAQSLDFCVMLGRLLVGFVCLNLQFSVSWLVDFQWGSCVSIFSFLCHGWQTFSGVHVALSLVFCVMVGRLLVGFVWLNLQFSVSWQVDFQSGSCGSIFSFLWHGLYCYTFFLQKIMLSVIIRFTTSVCPFGISKYFLQTTCISN